MDGATVIEIAERDAAIVSALRMGLQAMILTHGARIMMAGVTGNLNYERQILAFLSALSLLDD